MEDPVTFLLAWLEEEGPQLVNGCGGTDWESATCIEVTTSLQASMLFTTAHVSLETKTWS